MSLLTKRTTEHQELQLEVPAAKRARTSFIDDDKLQSESEQVVVDTKQAVRDVYFQTRKAKLLLSKNRAIKAITALNTILGSINQQLEDGMSQEELDQLEHTINSIVEPKQEEWMGRLTSFFKPKPSLDVPVFEEFVPKLTNYSVPYRDLIKHTQ